MVVLGATHNAVCNYILFIRISDIARLIRIDWNGLPIQVSRVELGVLVNQSYEGRRGRRLTTTTWIYNDC